MASIARIQRESALGRLIRAIEPWYHWGREETYRLDSLTPNFDDEVVGEVRFFSIQWFGVHIAVQFGRTPRRGEC